MRQDEQLRAQLNQSIQRRTDILARVLSALSAVCVGLVLLIVPVLQGGLAPLTLTLLTLLAGTALLAESWRALFRNPVGWRDVSPWVLMWLAATLVIFGQPAVRGLLGLGLELNGIQVTGTYWIQHINYWCLFTAYWILAWVVSRQPRLVRELLLVVVVTIALFESLYGLFAFAYGQETIFGVWPKIRFHESVTATFYNRNHLAAFLALAMPLGAGYLLSKQWDPLHHRLPVIRICITGMFLFITGAALLGTASRFGIFSALVGFVLWCGLYFHSELRKTRSGILWLVLLVAAPVVAGLWFGPDQLIDRLLELDRANSRLQIWQAMFLVSPETWLVGIGAGQFHDTFKLISPVGLVPSVWRAHSEYLQFVFEMGVIGTLLLAPVFVFWVKRCKPDSLDPVQRGALAGIIAIMIHALADFDLQVPGVAVLFWVAVGLVMSNDSASDQKLIRSCAGPGVPA